MTTGFGIGESDGSTVLGRAAIKLRPGDLSGPAGFGFRTADTTGDFEALAFGILALGSAASSSSTGRDTFLRLRGEGDASSSSLGDDGDAIRFRFA